MIAATLVRAMKNPHTAFALANFSKSGASGLYNTARPNYPKEALNHIIQSLPSPSPAEIVEIGAGTGLFTRMLIEQSNENPGRIKEILCVEPSEGMRIGFTKGLNEMTGSERGQTPVDIIDGGFDNVKCKTSEVDMIIIAQAFHWIGSQPLSGSSAINEFARVLKPGGKVVLIWNLEDRRTNWVGKLRDTYEIYEESTPQYRHGYWKSIFSLPQYEKLFSPAEFTTYHRNLSTTSEKVINRVLSKSFITAQEKNVQDEIVENVSKVVDEGDGKVWIDEKAGTFEYPYDTDVFILTRK